MSLLPTQVRSVVEAVDDVMSACAELDLSDRCVRHSEVGPRRLRRIQRSCHKPCNDERVCNSHERPWIVEFRGDPRPRSGQSCPARIPFLSRNVVEPLPSRCRIFVPVTISGIGCSVVQKVGPRSFAANDAFYCSCRLFRPEPRPVPDRPNIEFCERVGQLFRLNFTPGREAWIVSVVTGCVRMPDQKNSWHEVMLPYRLRLNWIRPRLDPRVWSRRGSLIQEVADIRSPGR